MKKWKKFPGIIISIFIMAFGGVALDSVGGMRGRAEGILFILLGIGLMTLAIVLTIHHPTDRTL